MNDSSNLMLVKKNLYVGSLKALYVYLDDLNDAYLQAISTLAPDEQHFLESLEEQIEVINRITEALTAAASPPNTDPNTAN
jgi:hypothetical protein